MHAFVTGATGFLGQHTIEQLLIQGWQVTALCRSPERAYSSSRGYLSWKTGDILDLDSIRKAMPKAVDAVFHLACDTSTSSLNHARQYQVNVTGTKNLAKVALEKSAIRFIHTSSIAVYGFHNGEVNEHSEMRGMDCPVSYFRTKYLAEEIIREYIKKGLDAVILNPTAIIGPYDSRNWVRMFDYIDKNRLFGVPPGHKSFCFAQDVAMAHVQAFIHGRCGENYILSGPTTDFAYIYNWISKQLGKNIPCRTLPAWLLKLTGLGMTIVSHLTRKELKLSLESAYILSANVTATSTKAQRELKYKHHFELDDMLRITFDWWLSQKNTNTGTCKEEAA